MKIEVWNENKSAETVVRLKLVQEGKAVSLVAVDQHGKIVPEGYLLHISSKGFYRYAGVPDTLELPIDRAGRIRDLNA